MKSFAAALLIVSGVALAWAQSIQVRIEDKPVTFDAPPMERARVTMVPIRNMVDAMGATMRWDLDRQMVSVWKANNRFDVTLGSRSAVVNDRPVTMDEPAFINKGRIYVPLKFIAQSSGYVISNEGGAYVLRPAR
jgi:hypothetical protein